MVTSGELRVGSDRSVGVSAGINRPPPSQLLEGAVTAMRVVLIGGSPDEWALVRKVLVDLEAEVLGPRMVPAGTS